MKRKLVMVLALAAAVFAAAVGSASASTASISPGGAITASGPLTFSSSFATFSCNVSIGGSITAGTYSVGNTFGSASSAGAAGCTNGAVVAFLRLPWSFALLAILLIPPGVLVGLLTNPGILITVFGIRCLYQGLVGFLIGAGNALPLTMLPLVYALSSDALNSPLCPTTVSVAGTMRIAPSQTVSVIP